MQKNTLTKSDLKERGWTESMIKKLLGAPDEQKRLYGYKHPCCIYYFNRVLKAEGNPLFTTLKEAAEKRRKSSLAAAQKKTKNIALRISNLSIDIPDYGYTKEDVVKKACKNYADHREAVNYMRGNYEELPVSVPDHTTADETFLRRITLNMIRYSSSLSWQKKKVIKSYKPAADQESAELEFDERVTNLIFEKYPWLRN